VKTPHILAISSFAVHGTASLKTFITFLGDKVLPVPSLMLNGLTNMSLVKKFEMPFGELLQSTFELAANRELELILYIGYLGNAGQAAIITEMIKPYRSYIKTIITDPVCGDHGRTYVPADVIEQWPALIKLSDVVFPNITELKILTGFKPDDEQPAEVYADQFKKLYPNVHLVITSVKTENGIGIKSYSDEPFAYEHPQLPKNFGGSGDAFLSLFMLNHFYEQLSFNDALTLAGEQTYRIIENTIANNSTDLILTIPKINKL
jgi:pyridoxine kinase